MLADIRNLRSINGRPAKQFLDSLITRQSSQSPVGFATEEDTLAAHPPLDQWLEGRKQLTVAQDGSAMFTSIQAALNAQRNGEVVRILDKGPYKESLRWENKKDCGLVSTVGTILESDAQVAGVTAQEDPIEHLIYRTFSSRLHGLTFILGANVETKALREKCFGIRIQDCDGFCLEYCACIKRELPHAPPKIGIEVFDTLSESPETKGRCIRSCIFAHDFIGLYSIAGPTMFSKNWIRSRNSRGGYSGVSVHRQSTSEAIHITENVFEADRFANVTNNIGDSSRTEEVICLVHARNTHFMPSGRLFNIFNQMCRKTTFVDNLSFARHPSLVLIGPGKEAALIDALRYWKIDGNWSRVRSDYGLSLSNVVLPEMTPISTVPLDRNFTRLDPATVSLRPGEPFPGALPSGPAPPEGDWFTELQNRFADSLQYITPEAKAQWTQPIELPKQPTSADPTDPADSESVKAAATEVIELNVDTQEDNSRRPEPHAKTDNVKTQQADVPRRDVKAVQYNDVTRKWEIVQREYPPELERLKQKPGFQKGLEDAESRFVSHVLSGGTTEQHGFLVFGRVVSEDAAIDPQQIEANLSINSDGYFVGFVPEPDTPIAFGLHAHHAVEVKPQGPPEPRPAVALEAVDLGTITLKRIERREGAAVRGVVQLQDRNGRSLNGPAVVTLQVVPHTHTDPAMKARSRSKDDTPPIVLTPTVSNRGLFSVLGLSPAPTTYRVTAQRDGFLPASELLRLESGSSNPRIQMTLEQKIPVVIQSLLWEDDRFDLSKMKTAEMHGGETWRLNSPRRPPSPPPGAQMAMGMGMGGMGMGFRSGVGGYIIQDEGKLTFSVGSNQRGSLVWTGCKDLGEGTLADFANIKPSEVIAYEDQDLELKHNHVYLLRECPTTYGPSPADNPRQRAGLLKNYSQYVLSRVQIPE